MERVNVIGSPGSGKSFVAAALAAACGLPPLVRLDALRHGPNWTEVPDDRFAADVAAAAAAGRWIMDGCYVPVRPLIWVRADTVIWTDLDRAIMMWVAAR